MRRRRQTNDLRVTAVLIVLAGALYLWAAWDAGLPRTEPVELPEDVAADLEELTVPPRPKPVEARQELKPGMSWAVSGAGTGAWNGTYEHDGAYGGKPAYKLDATHWLWWSATGDCWVLGAAAHAGDPVSVDAYTGGTTLPGTWSVATASAPAPSVAEVVPDPDPTDTGTKRTGFIGGAISPTLYPCKTVRPCRFLADDLEYVAFVGTAPWLSAGLQNLVLYCVDTDTWLALQGPEFAPDTLYNTMGHKPHSCLLDAGDEATLWFVDIPLTGEHEGELRAYPLTLNIAGLSFTVGSLFAPSLSPATDLALDDADTAWFVATDYKLYSWDLSGASASVEHDWASGRTEVGGHAGARFWYAGTAGTFFRTHNPLAGIDPDYIHEVSAATYAYTGERVPVACRSYAHDATRDLTYGMAAGGVTYRYRADAGDAWLGAGVSLPKTSMWMVRGSSMMAVGIDSHILT